MAVNETIRATDDAPARLVTRGDLDGVVCAALLRARGLVDDVVFVEPRDMQAGRVSLRPSDVTTNLPYVPGCRLAFDHHASEALRGDRLPDNFVLDPEAPSAARVVWNHFGGADAFPGIVPELMDAVDHVDAARFTRDEILQPTGWVLLGFLLDARTGLARFRDFRVDEESLLRALVDRVGTGDVDAILRMPDVSERVRLYFEHETYFREQLGAAARLRGDVAVVDLRGVDPVYAGNRFMIYALEPAAIASVHLRDAGAYGVELSVGRSVLDDRCSADVGELCLRYGGGGHRGVGTCRVDRDEADPVVDALVEALQAGA